MTHLQEHKQLIWRFRTETIKRLIYTGFDVNDIFTNVTTKDKQIDTFTEESTRDTKYKVLQRHRSE